MLANGRPVSRTLALLIVLACLVLVGVGLLPTGWTWAAPVQSGPQGGTVPTRTPTPPPTTTLYLPIVARFR